MPEPAESNKTQQGRNVDVVRGFLDGCVNGADLDVIEQNWPHDMSWHGGSLATYQSRDAFNRRKVAPGSHVLRIFNLVGDRAAVAEHVVTKPQGAKLRSLGGRDLTSYE